MPIPTLQGRLISVQVGLPAMHGVDEPEGEWETGFFKQPVDGPVAVGLHNLEGDGQADLQHHGGPDKAVLAYAAEHYPSWRVELHRPQLPHGAFGENLTIGGLDEEHVCIGDVWRLNDVLLEVSQPRQPCWKLGRRWQNKRLPKLVVQTGRSGWYFRVQRTGHVMPGIVLELESRPHPAWTIARANRIMYGPPTSAERRELATLPELSLAWKNELA